MNKNGMLTPQNSPCEYCGRLANFIADGGIATCIDCLELVSEQESYANNKKASKSKCEKDRC